MGTGMAWAAGKDEEHPLQGALLSVHRSADTTPVSAERALNEETQHIEVWYRECCSLSSSAMFTRSLVLLILCLPISLWKLRSTFPLLQPEQIQPWLFRVKHASCPFAFQGMLASIKAHMPLPHHSSPTSSCRKSWQ